MPPRSRFVSFRRSGWNLVPWRAAPAIWKLGRDTQLPRVLGAWHHPADHMPTPDLCRTSK